MTDPMSDERLGWIRNHIATAYDNFELTLADELLAEVERLRGDSEGEEKHVTPAP